MKALYVKTQLKSVINISRIVTIHYYEFDRNFVFEGEAHDFWEMVYVDRGCVKILRDGEEITLSQGEIVFHRPNEFHAIRAHESSPNFFVVSFVSSANAMRYFERYHTVLDKTLTPFISAVIDEAESTYEIPKNDPSLRKLIKKADAPIGGEQLIKTYLEQLLVLLIRNITREEKTALFPSKASMENHLVVAIKRLAEEKCEESFRVGDLCAALGYSESYLSKLFREQTGDTIAAYAIKVKIRFAKRMIREGLFNFSEISDRLHFDNPQYFSRVFKRVTGMTPTEFKSTLEIRNKD